MIGSAVLWVTIDKGFSNVKIAEKFGGPGRNRTDVQGFAILCITTLLPGHISDLVRSDNFPTMQVFRRNIDCSDDKLLATGATTAF